MWIVVSNQLHSESCWTLNRGIDRGEEEGRGAGEEIYEKWWKISRLGNFRCSAMSPSSYWATRNIKWQQEKEVRHLWYLGLVSSSWGWRGAALRCLFVLTIWGQYQGRMLTLTFYSLLVTWCTNNLTFNNYTLCPHCIYVFCIYLRTNSDLCHLQHKLIGFYNPDEKCLQRGTHWVFK